jgi:hypothetical protein
MWTSLPSPTKPPDCPGQAEGLSSPQTKALFRQIHGDVLNEHVRTNYPIKERFMVAADVNRGHLGIMLKGAADPKLTTHFRVTRDLGLCPSLPICEDCFRFYGRCVAPFDSLPPQGASSLREVNLHYLKGRSHPQA